LSTQAPASDETHPTLFSTLLSETQYTSQHSADETHTETTAEEKTTSIPSAETTTEDQNQSSQSLDQIQTPGPEISTDTQPFIPLWSHFSKPFSETSNEPAVTTTTTLQQYQAQEDTHDMAASEQSTAATTSRDDSSSSVSEVTSPLPMASTGKSVSMMQRQ
jgi:hypothetical protein